ncbi:exodeoxyribonuclease I [Methylosarcina fibrata]|uniref:exodeoxyribonuclease I n=1 Tax=Methylosarcina fibrata TaxID=105972 RepID=UPI00036A089E|nr:exodeoxyribonuclease I [Methylosarcina fibrata]
MAEKELYWHDYETFGTDPQRDRPAQFAGVRTDENLQQIDDPLVVYLKPSEDTLPHPDACLITGILPQLAEAKGLCEAEFIRLIHQQIAQANTCTLGYNTLRFDDELTRNCLYRNFYDPYAREWQNGNSRWDLIDVVRAARALRPDGIEWPTNEQGVPSFRLDQLTVANGIAHQSAHDALSDVYATIAFAKLLSQAQPRLFRFLWQNRLKNAALGLLKPGRFEPLVHVSGRYPAAKSCLALVVPLCSHPVNGNGILVYDLSVDPEPLLELSPEEIRRRLFTASQDLPEGIARIPLKTVHVNKCPVLAPLSVIRPADAERLELDLGTCFVHLDKIKSATGLSEKLTVVFTGKSDFPLDSDPDLSIYSGGFFCDADKKTMAFIRTLPPDRLAKMQFRFTDSRLPEMLFRYRARNYPDSLTGEESAQWKGFCLRRLTGREPGASITFRDYFRRLRELDSEGQADKEMIRSLKSYGLEKMRWLGLDEAELSYCDEQTT